jgi:hypothetical protein
MGQQRLVLVLVLVLEPLLVSPAIADSPPPPAILEKARAYIAKYDADKDGRLSLVEFAGAKLREANGGAAVYKITPKSDNYWKGLDANKDGLVTADEFAKGNAGDAFRALDTNKDRFVSAEELAVALVKDMRAQHDAKPGASFIERYDLDKDGKVSRAEFPGSDAVFERLDANHDGVIDQKDFPP